MTALEAKELKAVAQRFIEIGLAHPAAPQSTVTPDGRRKGVRGTGQHRTSAAQLRWAAKHYHQVSRANRARGLRFDGKVRRNHRRPELKGLTGNAYAAAWRRLQRRNLKT